MNQAAIVQRLRQRLPGLLAIYAFGSRITGSATASSDLDLSVLVEGYAAPLQLWELTGELSDLAGCPVDLVDFRAASTVLQAGILHTGIRWWSANHQAALYEAAVLSEKLELDQARAGLLHDIQCTGSVYAR